MVLVYSHHHFFYAFSYSITIENNSDETVRLTNRHWKILDSLHKTQTVDGEGVVGQTPTLLSQPQLTPTALVAFYTPALGPWAVFTPWSTKRP